MTTRLIELGLTRNPDGQSPSPWQIHIVATIVAGLGAWTADPDSPRTADFQTRIDRLRKTLVAGMSSHELSDTSSVSCSSATPTSRIHARSSSSARRSWPRSSRCCARRSPISPARPSPSTST